MTNSSEAQACSSFIQILGSEYHYEVPLTMGANEFQSFLHFLAKALSIVFIIFFSLYFLRKKKKEGVGKMLHESVFIYLDGIIEELIEEVRESTSVFYHQALQVYKKKMVDRPDLHDEREFFSHSEFGSRALPQNQPSQRIRLNSYTRGKKSKKPPSKGNDCSGTIYSLNTENLRKRSSREEAVSFKAKSQEIPAYPGWEDRCFRFEGTDNIDEKPISSIEIATPTPQKSEINVEENQSFVVLLNPSLDIYRNFYICNCYECCCECCCSCWFERFFNRVYSIYLNLKQKLLIFLIYHCKNLCFIFVIVGVFFDISLRNASAILISNCLQFKLKGAPFQILFSLYTLLDLILGSLFFFTNVFLVSFLTNRREFSAVSHSDQKTRGRMIFYHLNKGFTYGLFHFIFQLIFKAIFFFERPFYEIDEGSDTAIFSLLKFTFVFSFICNNYPNWKSSDLIHEDCNIIKFQNRYFTIQNTFLEFMPNSKTLLKFLKFYIYGKSGFSSLMDAASNASLFQNDSPQVPIEKFDFVQRLRKDLDTNLTFVKLQLDEQLTIVENQKFKRFLKNRGMIPALQLGIIYFLLFYSFLYMTLSVACLFPINEKYQYSESVYRLIYSSIFLLNLTEFTIIPLFFKFALKRRYYLDDLEGETPPS